MTTRSSFRVAIRLACLGFLTCGLASVAMAQASSENQRPRMATFDNAEGETCFSLSLGKVSAEGENSSDVMIFVDTSASQTGEFKDQSLKLVTEILENLNSEDTVQLLAIDLDPVPLNESFASPGSSEVQMAVETLRQRVALGSTNMKSMLSKASTSFTSMKNRNRSVIYIGDGLSRAGILHSKAFTSSVKKLVKKQITVSSFAVGPDSNVELLAALANHTGGNIIEASSDSNPQARLDATQAAASKLSATVHGTVFWPKTASLPDSIAEVYPRICPPLRSDRDSLVFGTLVNRQAIELGMGGVVNGINKDITLSVVPDASNTNYSFLPELLNDSRKNGGLELPTVGSEGLKGYVQNLRKTSSTLASLGAREMEMGDVASAKKFVNAALRRNPQDKGAKTLAMATSYPVQSDDIFGDAEVAEEAPDPFEVAEEIAVPDEDGAPAADDIFGSSESVVEDTAIEETEPLDAPAQPMADEAVVDSVPSAVQPREELDFNEGVSNDINAPLSMGSSTRQPLNAPLQMGRMPGREINSAAVDRIMAKAADAGQQAIDNVSNRNEVVNQKITKQVRYEIQRAQSELGSNPSEAINRLKNMIEVVDQTPELNESTIVNLRYSLESALDSARQKKLEYEAKEDEIARNRAVAASNELAADAYELNQIKIGRFINQFDSLMAERNYASAAGVADSAFALAPTSPEAVVATERARATINYQKSLDNMRKRELAFLTSIHSMERAATSFTDDRLITFPDAEEWLEKKKARAKFSKARLTGSPRDEAILDALEKPVKLEYEETQFSDVKAELEEEHNINIILDETAIDDSLTEEELITVRIRGVRLKNALRLMLKPFNATYIVRDEVLRIISIDNINDPENLVTDVYNVGDLVAPRFNAGGGFGGGGGGFGGGGGGGLGGGGGGGFGGGGQGGGGGGVFCVQDTTVSTMPVVRKASTPASRSPRAIELNHGGDANKAWTEYFASVHPAAADVRATVRKHHKAGNYDEIISLVNGAIRNDEIQPWMFEALGLAMKLGGKSQHEIERAFMSAVDFASSTESAMEAAKYMLGAGMEKRAISVLMDITIENSSTVEPYLLGLNAAERIKDTEARKWAVLGVLSQEWPNGKNVVKRAKTLAQVIRNSLQASGDDEALKEFNDSLAEAQQRDCIVEISYTGDADVDLYVKEPGGTVCSRLIRRTTAGGVHEGDNASAGPNQSGMITERYVLAKGFAGDYQVIVRKQTGKVTSGKVNVDVRHNVNSAHETRESKLVDIGDTGALVNFTLAKGRRTDSLEEHTFDTLVEQQMVSKRHILAQQLSSSYDSSAASDYYGGLIAGAQEGNPFAIDQLANDPGLNPGVVGYQPNIQFFQLSTTLQVQHATTSDRLYVMVSLSPFITDLQSVSNFNTLGGADTAGGGANATGGGTGGAAGGAL